MEHRPSGGNSGGQQSRGELLVDCIGSVVIIRCRIIGQPPLQGDYAVAVALRNIVPELELIEGPTAAAVERHDHRPPILACRGEPAQHETAPIRSGLDTRATVNGELIAGRIDLPGPLEQGLRGWWQVRLNDGCRLSSPDPQHNNQEH